MTATQPHAYLRTKVMTASPAGLRLMLLDGALKFAQQGKVGLDNEDYEAAYDGISRCQAILMELINALQPQIEPELCERLASLYTFLYTRLVTATRDRDPAVVEEVLGLLRYEHQTWSLLLEKLADENAQASHLQTIPHAQPAQPGAAASAPNGSLIGGTVSLEG